MSLRFILGRAGAGKTQTCLDEIKRLLHHNSEGAPLFFLVPEQATFQMEYVLLKDNSIKGTIRAQVISFRRLVWRVINETGGLITPQIDELGKLMILRSLVQKRKDELKIFFRSALETGFIEQLSSFIKEMKLYNIKPHDVFEKEKLFRENLQMDALDYKLHDLSLIYNDYVKYVGERRLDQEDYLEMVAKKIPDANFLIDSEIWIDSFAGFTPKEYDVLAALFCVARRVHIALCLDPVDIKKELAETDLFYFSKKTYEKLNQLAQKNDIKLEAPLILGHGERFLSRFREAPELGYLEKYFDDYSAETYNDKITGSIRLFAAANRRAEVEGVAREIIHICRDQGYRYRDIAIIFRDMEPYHFLISSIFSDYGIPFFIDYKRSVFHHPLVVFLRSFLEITISRWAYEPLFCLLKSGLIKMTNDEVDILENYVLAHGISGGAWFDDRPWIYRRRYTLDGEKADYCSAGEQELKLVNAAREKVVRYLLPCYRALIGKKKLSVRQITTSVVQLLNQLEIPQQLMRWRDKIQLTGDLVESQECLTVWNAVIDLFDQMIEGMGDEEVTIAEYSHILEAGLQGLRIGLIPPALDQVLVGNIERSRQPQIKVSFILGVNDGIFPQRLRESGIFSDKERQKLLTAGFELAPTSRQLLFHEQFLGYIAFTRAKRQLIASYPLADEEGKELLPSTLLDRVRELFPAVQEEIIGIEPDEISGKEWHFIARPKQALSCLVRRLRFCEERKPLQSPWIELYRWFLQEKDESKKFWSHILSSLNYTNHVEPLPPDVMFYYQDFGLKGSISRFERYASCPYSFFARYGLKLQPREIYRLDVLGMGLFFHAALHLFMDRLKDLSLDLGELTEQEAISFIEEVTDFLIPKLQEEILLSTPRYRYLSKQLCRILRRAVLLLREHSRRSNFKVVAAELKFGHSDGLPPLCFPLEDGFFLELEGRIDRVDLAEGSDKQYIRIIDYKSSPQNVRLSDVFHGLDLQLLTYLFVTVKNANKLGATEALPAGVFFFNVSDPFISSDNPLSDKKLDRERQKKFKLKGLIAQDKEVACLMGADQTGWSDLVPVYIKKDGTVSKNRSTINIKEFEILFKYLSNRITKMALEIREGKFEIKPYRQKQQIPCRYCDYRPVCQFDPLIKGNDYCYLKQYDNHKAMKEINALVKGGETNK